MEEFDLSLLISEMKEKHKCHTIILYGSRANNTHNENSDIDIVCFVNEGKAYTDTKKWNGIFLDAWIYSEEDAKNIHEFLKLLNGKVLYQKDDFGEILLDKIYEYYEKGPKKLPDSERQLRITWCLKTFKRIKYNDIEGNFRKIWLAHDLLAIYFELRDLWYLGSKRSFSWLKENEPQMYNLFENLYSPGGIDKFLEETLNKVLENQDF